MQKTSINSFEGGFKSDFNPITTPSNVVVGGQNFRLYKAGDNEFIQSNEKGNLAVGSLKTNYVCLSWAEYNGIAYIVSAEVINGIATGRGEIGTFPSPDYLPDVNGIGNIIQSYSALKNFSNVIPPNPALLVYNDFNSMSFNFTLETVFEKLLIQPDFDSTVNLILTDNYNKPRIINSRFQVLPDNKYKIIDRRGVNDSNVYTNDSFASSANLVLSSDTLANISLSAVELGGQVQFGNYFYYVKYITSEGDESGIVAESFLVSVFNGTTVATTIGGHSGLKSNKQVRMNVTGLDTNYSFFSLYVEHIDGEDNATRSAYKLDKKFQISTSSVEIVHTGYENTITVDVNSLNAVSFAFKTARTETQGQGRLFFGNLNGYEEDYNKLYVACQKVQLRDIQHQLNLLGINDINDIYNAQISQSSTNLDGWNGAYYNPQNIYNKLGYWRGESYPFGIRFFFKNNVISPVFPVLAIDRNNSTAAYQNISYDPQGWYIGSNGNGSYFQNRLGIYRFMDLQKSTSNPIFDQQNGGRIVINGIQFFIDETNAEWQAILNDPNVIGYQLMRGERIPDVKAQGYLIPTVKYKNTYNISPEANMYETAKSSESLQKFVPIIQNWLEGQTTQDGNANSTALHAGRIWNYPRSDNVGNTDKSTISNKRYAILSNDFFVSNTLGSDLNAVDGAIIPLGYITGKYIIPTSIGTPGANQGFIPVHFSLINSVSQSFYIGSDLNTYQSTGNVWPVKTSLVIPNTPFPNLSRFASYTDSNKFRAFDADTHMNMVNKYNGYIGAFFTNKMFLTQLTWTSLGLGGAEDGQFANSIAVITFNPYVPNHPYLDTTDTIAVLCNIYSNSSGIKTPTQISNTYNDISSIKYKPIGPRQSMSTLQAEKNNVSFGGDCFIGLGFRKLYTNASTLVKDAADNVKVENGYTVSVVNEGNYNIAFRGTDIQNTTTSELSLSSNGRSFPPYYTQQDSSPGDGFGAGISWRDYNNIIESGYINKGYNITFPSRVSFSYDINVPFIKTRYPNRITWSAIHSPNNFVNGYRIFSGLNYVDYDSKFGPIVKIFASDNVMTVICENGVFETPLNQRIEVGGDVAGKIFLDSVGVLTDNYGLISKEYGTTWQNSVIQSDNNVYGVDIERHKIWRIVTGQGLELLSELTIQGKLKELKSIFGGTKDRVFQHRVYSFFDKEKADISFIFNNGVTDDGSYIISYNEVTGKFDTPKSYRAEQMMSTNNRTFSFNNKLNSNIIWEHHINPLFCNYYGEQHTCEIEFVSNQNIEWEKIFTNLNLVQNGVYPVSVHYKNDFDDFLEQVYPRNTNHILRSNIDYKGSQMVFQIGKSANKRLRDKYSQIKIIYRGDQEVFLRSINTLFNTISY